MEISGVNSVSFNGLWEPVKKLSKESGTFNRDKVMYTVYDMVYHPFNGESEEAVKNIVNKHFIGRSFSLWDTFDGQNKADMFQMNYVRLGEAIPENEAEKYLEKGFKKEMTDGILDDESFEEAYTNATYAAYDVSKLDKEDIHDIAGRHFNLEI